MKTNAEHEKDDPELRQLPNRARIPERDRRAEGSGLLDVLREAVTGTRAWPLHNSIFSRKVISSSLNSFGFSIMRKCPVPAICVPS